MSLTDEPGNWFRSSRTGTSFTTVNPGDEVDFRINNCCTSTRHTVTLLVKWLGRKTPCHYTGLFSASRKNQHPDPDIIVDRPNLNDAGTVAFHRFFNSQPGEELVSGNGGELTTLADTSGSFQSFGHFFGFQAPALNNTGGVAFTADLDSGPRGIFVGSDPIADRVIQTGDTLDGLTVVNLRLCEEGLNDSGQLAILITLDDPSVPDAVRVAVYRATPTP